MKWIWAKEIASGLGVCLSRWEREVYCIGDELTQKQSQTHAYGQNDVMMVNKERNEDDDGFVIAALRMHAPCNGVKLNDYNFT